MSSLRLLITGGGGLLGSKVAEIAVKQGYEVYAGYYDHMASNGVPLLLDIRDKKALSKAFKMINPEGVIHSAALTDVDMCEKEKELAWQINVEGTRNVAEKSREHNAFLVYVSTDYVFSGQKGMYREMDETGPINHYGLTKLEGENIVKKSLSEWCIARPSVIYGSTPAGGKVNFALWALNNLRAGEMINVVTDQWVSPTLNTNLAQMIQEIVERRLTGIYHLAGATPLSRYEFTLLIAEAFNLNKSLMNPAESRAMNWIAKRPENSSLNVQKALETLKNKPLKIDDALTKLGEELPIRS